MRTLQADKGPVWWLSFSSDGAYLASASSGVSISLWDLSRGSRRRLKGYSSRAQAIAFAPRGPALAALCWGIVRLWPDPGRFPRTWVDRNGNEMVFRPDGAVLGYLHAEYIGGSGNFRALRFIDTERGEPADLHELVLPADGLWRLTWSPTDPLLAGIHWARTSNRNTLWLLRVEAGAVPQQLTDLPNALTRLTFSPDGQTLTLATREVIQRWDLQGQPVQPLQGHELSVNGVAYLPDGRLLSCSNDGTARTWDPVSGKCLDVRDWQLGELETLAVARDGMRAAVGSKTGTILIWDID
jgi:WD40 repeat protein